MENIVLTKEVQELLAQKGINIADLAREAKAMANTTESNKEEKSGQISTTYRLLPASYPDII